MERILCDYDIFPKVFPVGREICITVKPLGHHAALKHPEDVVLQVFALQNGGPGSYPTRHNGTEVPFSYDGCVRFSYTFPSEQEYFIRFSEKSTGKRLFQLSVYALDADLCGRYPFRGDLHVHTNRSDGKQAPAIVCAAFRKRGYDFLAITDHRRYYPALEAMAAYKDVPIGLTVCPGEEVHLPCQGPDCIQDVHIVNFGGKYSVNALLEGQQSAEVGTSPEVRSFENFPCPPMISEDEYRRQVSELAKTLDIPQGVEPFMYAGCVWVFEHIRKAEGLGIFCHPDWICNVHQVADNVTDFLLETHPFDAFEVLGGELYYEQNGFQTHRYYDMRARGIDFPVVGSSDCHNAESDNAYMASSIVFAPKNERSALIAAVKQSYSVAVDSISKEFRLVGNLRLARYATFLLNNWFPLHDALCYEEGRAMKDYVCGDGDAAEILRCLQGRTQKQLEKYFCF